MTAVTVADCVATVCAEFGVSIIDIASHRRSVYCARPRQIVMWMARRLTPRTLPEIGRLLGGRDHTTVIHGIKRIDAIRATDREFMARTDRLIHALSHADERQSEMRI